MPVLALLKPSAHSVALSGARVKVFQLSSSGKTGEKMATARTGQRGATSVRLPSTPDRVLVKVTGGRTTRKGKTFGKPFDGSMTTVMSSTSKRTNPGVKPFFAGTVVSLPSTVLAAYAAPRPGKKWHASQVKVSKFLGLPHKIGAVSYDYGMDTFSQELFNTNSFLAQAKRHGGIDRFVKKLSRDVAAGKKEHPFHPKSHRVEARGVLEAAGNISSVGTIVDWIAKIGFMAYGALTGTSKADVEQELMNELEQINSQLAQIIGQLGELQQSIDDLDTTITQSEVNTATSAAVVYTNQIKQAWIQENLVMTSAMQVCQLDETACEVQEPLLDSVTTTCNGADNSKALDQRCQTFFDNVKTFNTMCELPAGDVGGIQDTTIQLASVVGGSAVNVGPLSKGNSDDQGMVNLLAQDAATSNYNVISTSNLEFVNETWAWYYEMAFLGSALDAIYLGMQSGTTESDMGQINDQVAPVINALAGTRPSMPLGTVLSSGSDGSAYLWPSQVGMNAPYNWATDYSSDWVFNENASGQVGSITNTGGGLSASPILADTSTKSGAPTIPVVETLLPVIPSGETACDSKSGKVAPAMGTCTALIIGRDKHDNPTLRTEIKVHSAPIPSWQLPDTPQLSQLSAGFVAANTSGLMNGNTFAQWLSASTGFSEQLLTMPGSAFYTNNPATNSGIYAYIGPNTGNAGYFGGCQPGGLTYCMLPTWAASAPGTGLFDLNNGYNIGNQSGNFNDGCGGGGFNLTNGWAGLDNWTSSGVEVLNSGDKSQYGNLPCGMTSTVVGGIPQFNVFAMPLWPQLNGTSNLTPPGLPDPPAGGEYPENPSNPTNLNPNGLRTLFTALVPSNLCAASYSASAPPESCTNPRTMASQALPPTS